MAEARALKTLEEVEKAWQELRTQDRRRLHALQASYWSELDPLLKRRHKLVSGRADPTAEELEGFEASEEGAEAPPQQPGAGPKAKGVPYFWLTVLTNEDTVAEHISKQDEAALAALEDIRVQRSLGKTLLEFHFGPNPFFSNKVLKRGVRVDVSGSGGLLGSGLAEDTTEVDWKEGHNLTVREVAKKGSKAKKGKKKGGRAGAGDPEEAATRLKPVPSFFRFFSPTVAPRSPAFDPAALDSEGEIEQDAGPAGASLARSKAKLGTTVALVSKFADVVVPDAVHLYSSGPLKGGSTGSGDDEDEFEMVSAAADSIEGLPLAIRQRVHALQALQKQADALRDTLVRSRHAAALQVDEKAAALAARRKEALVADGALTVPYFWLRALKACEVAVHAVHRQDEPALGYLADVRCVRRRAEPPSEEGDTLTVEFEFLPNPFFSNAVLSKTFAFAPRPARLGEEEEEVVASTSETEVEWQEDQDLTLGRPDEKDVRRRVGSFFCLFQPGQSRRTFGIPGAGRNSLLEAREKEEELAAEAANLLVPHALRLYREMDGFEPASADEASESDGDDDDADSEEDGNDGEDESSAAAAAARKEGKKKRQGRWLRCSPAVLLMALLLATLAAELFVFFDEIRAAYTRSRK